MTEITNCPNTIGYFQNEQLNIEIPCACKSWRCDVCAKVRLNQFRDRVAYYFNDTLCTMWTLTLRNSDEVKIDDKTIMPLWNILCNYYRKTGVFNENTKFVWTKELTLKGFRHLHILINVVDVSINQLQKDWYRVTNQTSWIVDTGRPNIEIQRASGYISKYISKAIIALDKKEKVYGFSRNCPALPKYKTGPDWKFSYVSWNKRLEEQDLKHTEQNEFNDHIDATTYWLLKPYYGQCNLNIFKPRDKNKMIQRNNIIVGKRKRPKNDWDTGI